MNPRVAHLQAFFTTLRMRTNVLNLVQMSAFGHRVVTPSVTYSLADNAMGDCQTGGS